jgi:type VI secretion system secreted protein Hcp
LGFVFLKKDDPMADIYAFLELEGVTGESQDSQYKDKIELQSFSWGATNNSSFASGTGSGIGKGQVQDISCTKFVDKASLVLMKKCVNGDTIDSGKITLLKLSDETKIPYYEVKLTDIVVTSYQVAGSGDGQLPLDHFSMHFVQVNSTYTPQSNTGDASGSVEFNWDLQKNA